MFKTNNKSTRIAFLHDMKWILYDKYIRYERVNKDCGIRRTPTQKTPTLVILYIYKQ